MRPCHKENNGRVSVRNGTLGSFLYSHPPVVASESILCSLSSNAVVTVYVYSAPGQLYFWDGRAEESAVIFSTGFLIQLTKGEVCSPCGCWPWCGEQL